MTILISFYITKSYSKKISFQIPKRRKPLIPYQNFFTSVLFIQSIIDFYLYYRLCDYNNDDEIMIISYQIPELRYDDTKPEIE